MVEWLSSNWKELLGTGGFGVIMVAIIAKWGKNNSGTKVSQKIKTGDSSTSYQSGGNVTVNNDRGEKDHV